MGRVLTNNVALSVNFESALGVATTIWSTVEFNSISSLGAAITTVAREPVSRTRQRRKGTTVDRDSAPEFEADLTMEHVHQFIAAFMFARAATTTGEAGTQRITSAFDASLRAEATTPAEGFVHSALPAAIRQRVLVKSRGFTTAVNNGLFEVAAGGTTTNTPVTGTPGIVDETPTAVQNAKLETAGIRLATSDLSITVSAGVATLVSAANIANWSLYGLMPGQMVHIGGLTAGRQFSAGAGKARVRSISGATLVCDKLDSTLATDPGTGDSVDILFGAFFRNVAVGSTDYLERSLQLEAQYVNLQNPGPGDAFEYPTGNFANVLSFNLPLTEKALMTVGLVGQDTPSPTTTRKTGASTPIRQNETAAFNTSADIARLRITELDETGITSCFKSLVLTLNNQVTPEKCLGTLGALFLNTGNFLVDVEAQLLFTDVRVATAVSENRTVTLDFGLSNDDGALYVDIPSTTLGGGNKEFPVNESVLINVTVQAFEDPTLGYSVGVSTFPTVPSTF